jgi:hypothetical protein
VFRFGILIVQQLDKTPDGFLPHPFPVNVDSCNGVILGKRSVIKTDYRNILRGSNFFSFEGFFYGYRGGIVLTEIGLGQPGPGGEHPLYRIYIVFYQAGLNIRNKRIPADVFTGFFKTHKTLLYQRFQKTVVPFFYGLGIGKIANITDLGKALPHKVLCRHISAGNIVRYNAVDVWHPGVMIDNYHVGIHGQKLFHIKSGYFPQYNDPRNLTFNDTVGYTHTLFVKIVNDNIVSAIFCFPDGEI